MSIRKLYLAVKYFASSISNVMCLNTYIIRYGAENDNGAANDNEKLKNQVNNPYFTQIINRKFVYLLLQFFCCIKLILL